MANCKQLYIGQSLAQIVDEYLDREVLVEIPPIGVPQIEIPRSDDQKQPVLTVQEVTRLQFLLDGEPVGTTSQHPQKTKPRELNDRSLRV